jgi:hypothetical protein
VMQHQAAVEGQGRLRLVEDVQAGFGAHARQDLKETLPVAAGQDRLAAAPASPETLRRVGLQMAAMIVRTGARQAQLPARDPVSGALRRP